MKIVTAIASTTHIDRHNERMSKEALECFAKGICSKFIPVLVEHDPNRQIGVLFYGKVVRLNDGEYALYVVHGEFESEWEIQTYKLGAPNNVWKSYTKYLADFTDTEVIVAKKYMPPVIEEPNLAELLETHLDSTLVRTDGYVYKVKHFIASTGSLSIHVYQDHNPPHFHVLSKQRGINARFNLNSLDLINTKTGKIGSNDVKKIKNFFETHPDELQKLKSEHMRMNG